MFVGPVFVGFQDLGCLLLLSVSEALLAVCQGFGFVGYIGITVG